MQSSGERSTILRMLADGKITADQATRLLAALGIADEPEAPAARAAPAADVGRWRWVWAPIAVAGGALVLLALSGMGAGLGSLLLLACVQLPLLAAGATVLALGFAMRSSPWVRIRVDTGRDERPRRISLSAPLPLNVLAWFLRTFGNVIPGLRRFYGVDELIDALDGSIRNGEPLVIDVDEGNGERVQVHIG